MSGRRLRAAVALAAAAMVTTTGALPATGRPAPPGGGGGCQVHTLALPPGAVGGNVMDIEQVPGRGVVYYGTVWVLDGGGREIQQAVLWYGLDGPPVPVGPDWLSDEIAYELTSTGLINGETLDPATGRWRAWVQKIRTGRLTWVGSGGAGDEPLPVFARRINDRGALAGSLAFPDGVRASTWRRYHHDPDPLTGPEWVFAEAMGINDDGETVGSGFSRADGEEFVVPTPLRWSADGTTTPMATSTLGAAYPRLINDAGQAAGNLEMGGEWAVAHREAAFWPAPDVVVGLGLLPGGGRSDGFGLDADGRVSGWADVYDPADPGADEFGSAVYGFLWTADSPGQVQVLPSPYAWERGITDWRRWYAGAPHAVNADLDQVGTNAHGGYLDDRTTLRMVPTVYVDADDCGQAVQTTHTPFWLTDPGTQPTAAARGASDPVAAGRPAGYGVRTPGDRDLP